MTSYRDRWEEANPDRAQLFAGVDSQVHHAITNQFLTDFDDLLSKIYDPDNPLDRDNPRFTQILPKNAVAATSLSLPPFIFGRFG